MPPIASYDNFTGYSAPATSGSAPYPAAADSSASEIWIDYLGTATTGDIMAYTVNFSTGNVTLQARWTSSTTLIIERIVTIPGTNNGTATLHTFTGTSTQKPRVDGDICRIRIVVTRGAGGDNLTSIGYTWNGRSSTSGGTTGSFNVSGELTATGGTFALTGSSFRNRPNLHARTADGGGTYEKLHGPVNPTGFSGQPSLIETELDGVESDGVMRPQRNAGSEVLYVINGTGVINDQAMRIMASVETGALIGLFGGVRIAGSFGNFTGYEFGAYGFNGSIFIELYRNDGSGSFVTLGDASFPGLDDGTPHEYEIKAVGTAITVSVDAGLAISVTDSGYASGGPAVGAYRDDRTNAGVDVISWEVESNPDGTADPCADPGGTPSESEDSFTTNQADINGRTPDGSGVPALQVGVWCGPVTGSTGTIGTSGGAAVASARETTTQYVLIGTGLTNYRVYMEVEFDVLEDGGWVSATSRFVPGYSGYEVALFDTGELILYSVTGGVYTQLGSAGVVLSAGIPIILELDITGSAINAYVDGTFKISTSDSTYATGSPGMALTNGATGTIPTVRVNLYKVIAATGGPPPQPPTGPSSQTIALDHFTGAADQDISGRVADGVINPALPADCYNGSGTWVQGYADEPILAIDVTHDITPTTDRAFLGACNFTLLDGDVTSGSVDSWDGVVAGDLLILMMYTRIGSLHPSVPAGWTERANQDNGGAGGHLVVASRVATGSEPTSWTVNYTGTPNLANERSLAQIVAFRQGSVLNVSAPETWLSQQDLGPISGITSSSTSALFVVGAKAARFSMAISGNIPVLTVDESFHMTGWASSTSGMPGPVDIGPGAGFTHAWRYDPNGVGVNNPEFADAALFGNPTTPGAGLGVMLEIGFASFPPSPGDGYLQAVNHAVGTSGWPTTTAFNAPVILTDIPGLVGAEGYMIEAAFLFNDFNGADLIKIFALADPLYDLAYELVYFMNHSTGGAIVQMRHAGVGLPIWSSSAPVPEIGTLTRVRLCVDGTAGNSIINFRAFVNDVPVGEGSHFFDASGWPPGANPLWPGVMIRSVDNYFLGRAIECDYFRVALTCEAGYPSACDECTGNPDNPWPWEPPPTPPPTQVFGEWPMKLVQWRDIIDPTAARKNLGYRRATSLETYQKWVMKNLQWRLVQMVITHDEDPPSDDPTGPPHYDPCELYPPLPLPPVEPLGPPPARLFFTFDLPVTTIPQLFNTAVNATGPWTPLNLSQATARGGFIIGGVGGYSKYQSGGHYDRALMAAWIESHASFMSTLVGNPYFYGQIAMDDHAAFDRWNWPSGWTINDVINEVSWICGYWKTLYPGLRVGIRAREAQFSGTNYPSNIDFMMAQYRYWGLNRTPVQFVSEEMSLATGRGHAVLFSVNFENGGLGPSSPYGGSPYSHRVMYEVGPGELNTIWEAETVNASNMHGIGGWKYSTTFLSHPGILDVIAVRRNALALLGPF